jgi:hypothetical protein
MLTHESVAPACASVFCLRSGWRVVPLDFTGRQTESECIGVRIIGTFKGAVVRILKILKPTSISFSSMDIWPNEVEN